MTTNESNNFNNPHPYEYCMGFCQIHGNMLVVRIPCRFPPWLDAAKCGRKHMANHHASSREEMCKHRAWSTSSQWGPFRWAYVMIARPRNPARLIYWSMMMHVWNEKSFPLFHMHVSIYYIYSTLKKWCKCKCSHYKEMFYCDVNWKTFCTNRCIIHGASSSK